MFSAMPYKPGVRSLLLATSFVCVALAETAEDGLAMARDNKPAAILMDIMLPGADGWGALDLLKRDARTKDIPVVVQTVLDEENFAYALGAAGFLKKPITAANLREALVEARLEAGGGQILLVDDDVESLSVVGKLLRREGWTVRCAKDGVAALDEMQRAAPDIIIADLMMPRMDGYAFVAKIREHDEWNKISIVVFTADDIARKAVRDLAPATSAIVRKGSMPLAEFAKQLRRLTARRANGG